VIILVNLIFSSLYIYIYIGTDPELLLGSFLAPSKVEAKKFSDEGDAMIPIMKEKAFASYHYIFLKFFEFLKEARNQNYENQFSTVCNMLNIEEIKRKMKSEKGLENNEIAMSLNLSMIFGDLFEFLEIPLRSLHQFPVGVVDENTYTPCVVDTAITDKELKVVGFIESKKIPTNDSLYQLMQYHVIHSQYPRHPSVALSLVWSHEFSSVVVYGIFLSENEQKKSRYRYTKLYNFSINSEKTYYDSLLAIMKTWKYISELPENEVYNHSAFVVPEPLSNMISPQFMNKNVLEYMIGENTKIMKIYDYHDRFVHLDQRRHPNIDMIHIIDCLPDVDCIEINKDIHLLIYTKIKGTHQPKSILALIHACDIMKKLKDNNIVHGDIRIANFLFEEDDAYLIDFDWAFKKENGKTHFYVEGYQGSNIIHERHSDAMEKKEMKMEHDWFSFWKICEFWLENISVMKDLKIQIEKGDFEETKKILFPMKMKTLESLQNLIATGSPPRK
jgi:hypothetical protein